MKRNIIIFCVAIITLSLTAFSIKNWNGSEVTQSKTSENEDIVINTSAKEKINTRIFTDFIYDVGPRFNPITKADLDTIRSFNDIIGEKHAQRIVIYKSVSVIIMDNDKQSDKRETGYSDVLTPAQLKFLQSLDYSTNLVIWADYEEKNSETGELEDTHWTPYLTIVPEKQAGYANGKDALKKHLKDNSEEARNMANVEADKLQPAKLFFTVTKTGTIENVRLDRTSNYPLVDKKMIELIRKTSGTWLSAENHKGEKVNQELVVSFGLMGC